MKAVFARHIIVELLILVFACSLAQAQAPGTSSRQRLETPGWLNISGSHRLRFENLDNQYRLNRSGGDQILLLRTNLLLEASSDAASATVELMDTRSYLGDGGTPLNDTEVNPVDLLQAYVAIATPGIAGLGGRGTLKLGRFTQDMGNRRLMARNRYRNTINAFTGFDWHWEHVSGRELRAFFSFPVQRRFSGTPLENKPKTDIEGSNLKFWGIAFNTPFALGSTLETHFFGLDEKDSAKLETRDRELYTPGFRLYRAPAPGRIDFEVEAAYQWGTSRNTASPIDIIPLDHRAHFVHLEVGHVFNRRWQPRTTLLYDYASGDRDPNDGRNGTFDTLYGARRFEFGPTSLYGSIARANLDSIAFRLDNTFSPELRGAFTLRDVRLASAAAPWTTGGILNPPGVHARKIGTQWEYSLQWEAIPGRFQVETGFNFLTAGEVMRNAGKKDVSYGYLQLLLRL